MSDNYMRPLTDEERQRASQMWNERRPAGTGRNPFARKITRMRDAAGRPLKMDGSLDLEQWIKEANERS